MYVAKKTRKTADDLLLAYTVFERKRKIGGIERAGRERKLGYGRADLSLTTSRLVVSTVH